jgi:tetratricopeptide (TPR) repeat protein
MLGYMAGRLTVLGAAALMSACAPARSAPPPSTTTPAALQRSASAPPAPPAVQSPTRSTEQHRDGPLEVADDFPAALAIARKEGRALFVDAWAEWCHTCLSMEHTVFQAGALAPFDGRLVTLKIDTDNGKNADFVERYSILAWPTFFVIEPKGEKVIGVWTGSASATEMRDFVTSSLDAIDALEKGLHETSPLGLLVLARVAQTESRYAVAAERYQQALAAAPPDWKRRSEAAYGWIASLSAGRRFVECRAVGKRFVDSIEGAALPIDFASYYLGCLGQERGHRPERERVLALTEKRLENLDEGRSADDRADGYAIVARGLESIGTPAGARRAREKALAILESAARKAGSAEEAQTYDYGRAQSYVALGRADAALAMLEERERQLPESSEPPGRLAAIYTSLNRLPEAVAALDRAIAHAHDLRRLVYLSRKAALHEKLGDRTAQLAALEAEVAGYRALPATPTNRARLADAEGRLAQAKGR